jgi:hypothetical protein
VVALFIRPAPGAAEDRAGVSEPAGFDSVPARVVYTPTAFVVDPGRTRLTLTGLVLFGVERGFDDLLQVEFQANLPVLFSGGSLWVKSTLALSETARIGAYAVGSLTWAYDPEDIGAGWNRFLQFMGGGIVASFGRRDLFANLSLSAATFYGEFGQSCLVADRPGDTPACFVEPGPGRILLPGWGMSWHPGGFVRLSVEVTNAVATFAEPGQVWLILPGIRLYREHWFLEYFAILPAFPGAREFYRVMPLAVPMFGAGWH